MLNFNIKDANTLKDIKIIVPNVSIDKRGKIWTSFLESEIEKLLPLNTYFKHDKFSHSKKNVLRGIHGDNKTWKLITCVYGAMQQVVVDCKQNSDTYRLYESFEINDKNPMSILIPPQYGNAFYVKSKLVVYHYKLAYDGNYLDADKQFSYKWNNPNFNIKWPTKNPILSIRDK